MNELDTRIKIDVCDVYGDEEDIPSSLRKKLKAGNEKGIDFVGVGDFDFTEEKFWDERSEGGNLDAEVEESCNSRMVRNQGGGLGRPVQEKTQNYQGEYFTKKSSGKHGDGFSKTDHEFSVDSTSRMGELNRISEERSFEEIDEIRRRAPYLKIDQIQDNININRGYEKIKLMLKDDKIQKLESRKQKGNSSSGNRLIRDSSGNKIKRLSNHLSAKFQAVKSQFSVGKENRPPIPSELVRKDLSTKMIKEKSFNRRDLSNLEINISTKANEISYNQRQSWIDHSAIDHQTRTNLITKVMSSRKYESKTPKSGVELKRSLQNILEELKSRSTSNKRTVGDSHTKQWNLINSISHQTKEKYTKLKKLGGLQESMEITLKLRELSKECSKMRDGEHKISSINLNKENDLYRKDEIERIKQRILDEKISRANSSSVSQGRVHKAVESSLLTWRSIENTKFGLESENNLDRILESRAIPDLKQHREIKKKDSAVFIQKSDHNLYAQDHHTYSSKRSSRSRSYQIPPFCIKSPSHHAIQDSLSPLLYRCTPKHQPTKPSTTRGPTPQHSMLNPPPSQTKPQPPNPQIHLLSRPSNSINFHSLSSRIKEETPKNNLYTIKSRILSSANHNGKNPPPNTSSAVNNAHPTPSTKEMMRYKMHTNSHLNLGPLSPRAEKATMIPQPSRPGPSHNRNSSQNSQEGQSYKRLIERYKCLFNKK